MKEDFDARFQRALLETVSSNRVVCEAISEADHGPGHVIKSEQLRKFVYHFNRLVFSLMCDFGQLSFTRNFNWRSSRVDCRSLTCWQSLKCFLSERRQQTKKRWPYFLLAVYVFCNIYLLVGTYFHYIYNANVAKFNKLQDYLNNRTTNSFQDKFNSDQRQVLEGLKLDFQATAFEARKVIKFLGSIHPDWPFVMQNLVLVFILTGFYLYILLPVHQILNGWSLLVPLLILDAHNENRVQTGLILEELKMFAANSWTHSIGIFNQMSKHWAEIICHRPELVTMADECLRIGLNSLEQKHSILVGQLREIALSGRLKPINRLPARRDRLALFFFWVVIINEIYIQMIVFAGRFFLEYHFQKRNISREFDSFQDYFYEFAILLVIQVTVQSSTLFGSILITTWFDQVEAARLLHQFIAKTIQLNESRFKLMVGSSQAHQSGHLSLGKRKLKRALEHDLLVVVIRYRILTKVMRLARTPISMMSFAAFWFAASLLVISRLHTPYFNQDTRSINLAFSIGCVCGAFLYLYPLCQMHHQAIKTFSELWNLVAQLSYFETVPRINKLLGLESNLAVLSLRRSLADSGPRTRQLACKILTVSITGTNLIRTTFWACLIIMSISSNTSLGGEGFASLSSDPFGLFEFMAPIIRGDSV